MENKEIEKKIQKCFEAIEKRTDLEFSYQWLAKQRGTKTQVEVTLAENSDEHYGGGRAGFSVKTKAGIYWVCLFKKEIEGMVNEHPYFKGDIDKVITNVCIHEVLHTLDRIKNGKETKKEQEIIGMSIYYTDNLNLPIEIKT